MAGDFYWGLGMQAAGLGLSTVSAGRQAGAQRNTFAYQAQVAANNAALAGYQAEIAQQTGAQQEQNSMMRTANVFSTQRAAMAANGVDLGQGSATDVLASTQYMGARDAMTIRDNTARQVWGLNAQKANYLAEQQADLSARNAINPDMAMLGTFLGGAGAFASNWYKYYPPTPSGGAAGINP